MRGCGMLGEMEGGSVELKQVLNNNALLVCGDSGGEEILIGRGIAFGLSAKRPPRHLSVPEERIQKRFAFANGDTSQFAKLIRDIPSERVLAADEVVQFIRSSCTHVVSESIYLTLVDHVNTLIERLERGISFDPALLNNVRLLYREEYSIGVRAVNMLRQRLHVNIDDSEANFFALHIVNAEMDVDMERVYRITSLVEDIVGIVRAQFSVRTDTVAYDRFVTHCRFFGQRIISGDAPSTTPLAVPYQTLQASYPAQGACIDAIGSHIECHFSYAVSEEDRMYLLMHLIRLTAERQDGGDGARAQA